MVKNYPDIEEVFLALIEPFNDPTYTTISYSRDFLLAKGTLFTNASRYALEPDPPAVAGPKQCKWCSAQAYCPTLIEFITSKLLKYGKVA